jgi:hypothetical protein
MVSEVITGYKLSWGRQKYYQNNISSALNHLLQNTINNLYSTTTNHYHYAQKCSPVSIQDTFSC